MDRSEVYDQVISSIKAQIIDENDWISVLSTATCELHNAFEYFHWTGFYRHTSPELLKVGPYQGGHGCLEITFDRGICGVAASSKKTQLVPDVEERPEHIACSSTTRSEIVVPVSAPDGRLLAVLDVDSDELSAFNEVDKEKLEHLCSILGSHHSAPRE